MMYRIEATVKIRRNLGIPVRECAEQLDGKTHVFTRGWVIDDIEHYMGEVAWIPEREDWPSNTCTWIAEGDLTDIKEKHYDVHKS